MKLYRLFMIYILGRCNRCWEPLGWGQWNDGVLAGRPFCFNPYCPNPKRPRGDAKAKTEAKTDEEITR